jgi:hypothetical protein
VGVEFERAGRDCAVEVEVGVNEDPAELVCPDLARGFPVCRATIAPPARGYADFLGWVQPVNSADLAGEFSIEGPAPLPPDEWDRHRPCLREAFPRWSFVPGFSGRSGDE